MLFFFSIVSHEGLAENMLPATHENSMFFWENMNSDKSKSAKPLEILSREKSPMRITNFFLKYYY